MAVTLTPAELSAAIRLGDSTEETAEATRLLGYVTAAISRHLGTAYEDAPEAVVNEAGIRLAGYLFDMPNAGRGLTYANAGRNSGAWVILLPYRIHRAGSTDDAVAAAQEAVGSTSNPVTDVAISGGNLVVTFNDGTTRDEPLPAGMTGDGTDQAARDAAAAAQSTGDGATTAAAAAQSDIDAHEASTHNTDAGARTAAAAAAATAATAQTTASTARDAAAAAQGAIAAHERAPHNTDGTARTAAAAAAATAATAQTTASTARDAAAAAQADADTAQATAGQAQATATAASTAANAAQSDIDDHKANHPAGMGGGPAVLYEAASVAIGASTGLIAGDVFCPETGDLEFYFEGLTGTRQGAVAYARIPVARIRGAVSALNIAYSNNSATLLAIPHGANRGVGVAVQTTTSFLMLSAQAPGDFYIRVLHTG